MSLPRLAVDRPVTTVMMSIIVIILGFMALGGLSVDLMPEIDFPTVTVTALYPGAGPEEIETLVTRPLEQALSSIHGFDRLSSRCIEGSTSISVQFHWGVNLDVAIADMRQAIDGMLANLPDGIEPPTIRRYDSNSSPIMYLGVKSDLPPIELTQLTERLIIPQLERLDGVARVGMRGEVNREIQVDLDYAKLTALGMGVNEIVTALERGNVSLPAGDYEEGQFHRLLRGQSEFTNLEEIRSLVVRQRGGAVVHLRDVADVIDGHERITQVTRVDGEPGLTIYLFQQSGANTIDVSDAVHEEVEKINRELPQATLLVRSDKSDFIREAIANVQESAWVGMLLAGGILMLFLRSFRSVVVIAISMPLSVLATFVLIYFQGFTLNLVSFGGLALGLGMLVDNSIVVLESIYVKHEEGLSPRDAAIEGTKEVASAVTAATLTTLIVFLPLMFIPGVTAILLHQLAYVVSFSLMCSLIASLTLTPMLTARLLANHPTEDQIAAAATAKVTRRHWIIRGFQKAAAAVVYLLNLGLHLMEQAYGRMLTWCLKHPAIAAFPILLATCAAAGLWPRVGTEFLPQTDDGRINVTGVMAPGIQLGTLDRQARIVEQTLLDMPDNVIKSLTSFIGDEAEDGDEWNQCRFMAQLPLPEDREMTAEEIRSHIASSMPDVAGMKVTVRIFPAMPFSRMFQSAEGDSIAVLVRGHDPRTAAELAEVVEGVMKETSGLVNVESQQEEQRPQLVTRIDREKASLLGITVDDVAQALQATVRGVEATVFREDGDEFAVMVRLRPGDREEQGDLGRIGVTTPTGQLVPLENLMRFESNDSPLAIERLDRERFVTVSAGIENRDLGSVVRELQGRFAGLQLPDGFHVEIAGDYEEQEESFQALNIGLILAIVLMYMIMAAQFESLLDPLLILGTLPLGAIGVLMVLTMTETTLNVQSFIGIIVLSGIVVDNAIVMLDYANQLRHRHPEIPLLDIVVQASTRRLRPILMTTLTTILGMLPIALGIGAGAELQAPMARVVVAGMISGTLTTLVAIPILYLVVHTWLDPARATSKRESIQAAPVPVAATTSA